MFIIKNRGKYDVVNFYHWTFFTLKLVLLFKIFNPKCKVYIKLDLVEKNNENSLETIISNAASLKERIKRIFLKHLVDLYSVETKIFFNSLRQEKVFKGKIIHLYNGAYINNFKDSIGVKKENIILTVGRIGVYEKNHELLLNVLSVIDFSKLRNWKVYLVGPIQEGFNEYAEKIFKENPNLRDRIFFLGEILDKNKLYNLYKKSKIFVMTSRSEGFCLVIPEAMFFSNYVISTWFPAIEDLLDKGRVGRIVKSNSIDVLRKELENLMKTDKKDLEKMGYEANKYMEKNFMWKKIIFTLNKKLIALIEQER